jgi:hypothetical protein
MVVGGVGLPFSNIYMNKLCSNAELQLRDIALCSHILLFKSMERVMQDAANIYTIHVLLPQKDTI